MTKYKPSDFEAFRKRCAQLKELGWPQVKIAQALGMTEGWVSRTLKKYKEQGTAGLVWRKPPGGPTRLTSQQFEQLALELSKGAEAHGFAGDVWTRPRVNTLIEKLFGVRYDITQIGRLLKKIGWSRQKPGRIARQQNPEAVQGWRQTQLPDLKKSK